MYLTVLNISEFCFSFVLFFLLRVSQNYFSSVKDAKITNPWSSLLFNPSVNKIVFYSVNKEYGKPNEGRGIIFKKKLRYIFLYRSEQCQCEIVDYLSNNLQCDQCIHI